MRAINVFLSILISLLLALAVFEGGLRLFPGFRPADSINEFDEKLGWSKRPGAVVTRSTPEFDITFEINSHGLRDDERATLAKSPNTFRVMMLGDSFVLGYTVDRADLFVDMMAGWWRSEERRVEVINAGTEGYSTDQQVRWFQEHGADYDPDLVLIFPYENDIYWNGQERYTRYPKPRYSADGTAETGALEDPGPRPWLTRFAIGNFLGFVAQKMSGGNDANRPHFFQHAPSNTWIYSEFAPLMKEEPPFLADALARTKGALSALKTGCDELDARLIVVPIPSESAIQPEERERFRTHPSGLKGIADDHWSPDLPVDHFLSMADDLGIETLDPRSTLRASFRESEEPLYFDQEWHFNPHGNEVFARFLLDELNNLKVFPSGHEAIAAGAFPEREDDKSIPGWVMLFAALWVFLGGSYALTYKDDRIGFVKVGVLLAVIFAIVITGARILSRFPNAAPWLTLLFVAVVVGFIVYKLGRRVATIAELLKSFTLRGHWYLMPLVVVLLTIGSLLVVAASSPLIAPFIYTLF